MRLEAVSHTMTTRRQRHSTWRKELRQIWNHRWLYLLLLPGLLFFVIYVYVPLLGNIIAFQDYSPFRGFTGSNWVGLKHFERLFADPDVGRVLWNTIFLNGLQLALVFPVPIILALLLNEVRVNFFKRTVQSIVYLPHFISWVIIVGIWYQIFGSRGLTNQILAELGMDRIGFLSDPNWFRVNFLAQNIWKESGWGTIIYLAALAGIPEVLYEAAAMDGATRWQRMRYVTLPGILPVIMIILILNIGNMLNVGFEHIFLLLNSATEPVAQVLDTFVYTRGILNGNFSFATAVGLVKSIVGLFLVLGANRLARRFGGGGLF